MASFWTHQDATEISIPRTEEVDGVTLYVIEVKVNDVIWYVKHRYNDFYELHQYLVVDHGIAKDILPPKKVIKNKCPLFIENRKNGLEAYLKHILKYLQRTMPRIFLYFLCFQEYDTFFTLQDLAFKLYSEGDIILQTTKKYTFNVFQLHAISECFKSPFPDYEEFDSRYDPSHVMDLCSQLQSLKVIGRQAPYKASNIVPNSLPFDLSAFRMLESLEINGINLKNLTSVGNLRETLKTLTVQHTSTSSISEVLTCDVIHKSSATEKEIWQKITDLDLNNNNINCIDNAIKLVPNLSHLNLTQNNISKIDNLTHLANLSNINLSNNLLSDCTRLHTKLGNVKIIDFSQNQIKSLQGFEKLYSLESLDVSCNQISDIEEIKYIGELPCLENIRLTGNPVAVIVDYRVKVLEYFGTRAAEIYLDNEKATQKEIDTAFVLQALRIVKEGKTPNLNISFQ